MIDIGDIVARLEFRGGIAKTRVGLVIEMLRNNRCRIMFDDLMIMSVHTITCVRIDDLCVDHLDPVKIDFDHVPEWWKHI